MDRPPSQASMTTHLSARSLNGIGTVRLDAATGMGAVTGYARLSEGTLGEVIASFTLNVPEG